jgi:glucose-6-phosphate 1-dehydrogenase
MSLKKSKNNKGLFLVLPPEIFAPIMEKLAKKFKFNKKILKKGIIFIYQDEPQRKPK